MDGTFADGILRMEILRTELLQTEIVWTEVYGIWRVSVVNWRICVVNWRVGAANWPWISILVFPWVVVYRASTLAHLYRLAILTTQSTNRILPSDLRPEAGNTNWGWFAMGGGR